MEHVMMDQYKKRIADTLLVRKLEGKGAVLVEGAKWCGKTTTAEQVAKSILYMSDSEKINQYLELADVNPKQLLQGETPRLLDEWQLAPKLWDAVRFEVDHRKELGQFILTGSAVPVETEDIHHTGTGRFARLKMRTMSLFESGESNGSVSLANLFNEQTDIEGANDLSFERIAFLACRGGWPQAIEMRDAIALDQAFDYCDAVVNADISRVDKVARDPERTKRLLRAYARHQGAQVANTVIKADIAANDNTMVDDDTLYSYITALKKIFVIEDMPAWNPNLRSKTAIRTSDTRYFVDPSIATAALCAGPGDLVNDLKTFGFLFETLVVRDLRIYAESLGGEVRHYHDKTGLECDAVLHLPNGGYALLEVKTGGKRLIEEGAKTLANLSNLIASKNLRAPAFRMIVTAVGDYAYERKEDGVIVCPLSALRP